MTSCGGGLWMTIPGGKFAPVPLTGITVKASIIDLVAEVEIVQSYVNPEAHLIEVVYKFPLDEKAAVCQFSATIDGYEFQGEVQETVDAETECDGTIRTGKRAFMLQAKGLPDIGMVKMAKLIVKSSAIIRLTYVTELKMEGKEIRFYLPSAIVAPRYVNTYGSKSNIIQLYEFKFEANVSMTSGVKGIRSPTHNISTSNNLAMKKTVTLMSEANDSLNQDLLLYIQVDNVPKDSLILEKSAKGSSALMLSILPKFNLQKHKAELIFVIDHSRSMKGAAIEQTKKALLMFLHSLPVGVDCYLNIVGFGMKQHLFFPEGSRKYGDDVGKLVREYTEASDDILDESEIFDLLKAVLVQPTIDGYLRQVFVLTNGVVTNRGDVISLVQQCSDKARFFALGLGSSPSHDLVEGIARAGNGTAFFISFEEEMERKVMQQLRDALHPSWTNIELEWEGFKQEDLIVTKPQLRQAPTTGMIPSVFNNKHLVVYALLEEGAHIPQEATLILHSTDKSVLSIKVLLNPVHVDGLLIHRVAALKLIQSELQNLSNQISKKEAVKLAYTYGLLSRFTFFVAVGLKKPCTASVPGICLAIGFDAEEIVKGTVTTKVTDSPVLSSTKKARLSLDSDEDAPLQDISPVVLDYSCFRTAQTFRCECGDYSENFTCFSFSPCGKNLIIGSSDGKIEVRNIQTEETLITLKGDNDNPYGGILNMEPNRKGELLLTSNSFQPFSLWSLENLECKHQFKEIMDHVEFSKNTQDKIVGNKEKCAFIYDVSTGLELMRLNPKTSKHHSRNQATFHPSEDVILFGDSLWDVKSGKRIHKFYHLNDTIGGTFHPNGREIVASSGVWDIRFPFTLLRTVPGLDHCQVTFSNSGQIIYALRLLNSHSLYKPNFKTLDARDYSLIGNFAPDRNRDIYGLGSNTSDTQIAVGLSTDSGTPCQAIVQLYDVGLSNDEDDESDWSGVEDEESDWGGVEDEDSDSSEEEMEEDTDGGKSNVGGDEDVDGDANYEKVDLE